MERISLLLSRRYVDGTHGSAESSPSRATTVLDFALDAPAALFAQSFKRDASAFVARRWADQQVALAADASISRTSMARWVSDHDRSIPSRAVADCLFRGVVRTRKFAAVHRV